MKNILLLGDSIRMSYQPVVKELLEGRANVYGPMDNGRWSGYTLNTLRFWLPQMPTPDIVHWNNGIWDMGDDYHEGRPFYPPELYEESCRRIIMVLRQITKNPNLPILGATTTPLKVDLHDRMPLYNDILTRVVTEHGGTMTDLYSAIDADRNRYIGADNVHLVKEGVDLAAKLVVQNLEQYL
ncbi:MAG: SGNH/GDSL hydrolase family protein [Ruminococcaceae bacterium]|nr:SGNH/GDSL hydrolase family protein [Oscillospiraceae bacterium]